AMTRSDLILCSIASREGLVTSTQLAQAVLEDSPGDGASLAERLERIGALTPEQRASLEEQARIALQTVSLDGTEGVIRFSPDSTQVAFVTSGSLSLWDAATGRPVWLVPHTPPDLPHRLRWSVDQQALIVQYQGLSTALFDARSGERLARFLAAGSWASQLRPDLRAKVVVGPSSWDLRPMPQPVTDPPAESLSRSL